MNREKALEILSTILKPYLLGKERFIAHCIMKKFDEFNMLKPFAGEGALITSYSFCAVHPWEIFKVRPGISFKKGCVCQKVYEKKMEKKFENN